MKTIVLSVLIVLFFSSAAIFAQETKTEKFKVYGDCGLCKTRIQNAALFIDGVTKANWDKDSKILQVTYNPAKTDIDVIQTVLAKVGHDTEKHKAPDYAYNRLPASCKYRQTNTNSK